MSNPGETDQQKEDTLAALHGLNGESSDESEHEEADLEEEPPLMQAESHDDPGASSAASGFVGMLAKEGSEKNANDLAATPPPVKSKPDAIHMARELSPDELPASYRSPTAASTKKPVKKVPGWYHGAMPIMFTMGAVLFLIGAWAVGGLIYMAATRASEAEPGYPLIQRDMNDDTTGIPTYTSWSEGGAAALAICVPVAVAMEIMGMMMLKQINAEKRRAEK